MFLENPSLLYRYTASCAILFKFLEVFIPEKFLLMWFDLRFPVKYYYIYRYMKTVILIN